MTIRMSRSTWRTGLPSPAGPKSTVFTDHVADPDALVKRLLPFDVICVTRERTPLRREIIERLPQLKLIASTGQRNASIDRVAAEERGIRVTATGYRSTPTIEMTWALILASARQIVRESNSVRDVSIQPSAVPESDHEEGCSSSRRDRNSLRIGEVFDLL